MADLKPLCGDLYLCQGDITRLECGAIVNAANSGMTGCYVPCHACIDNYIHTFAGIQLRLDCAQLMERQGHEESTGQAKITKAYNLPCNYVLHTVGPIIEGRVTPEDERLLASCYRSCLELGVGGNTPGIIKVPFLRITAQNPGATYACINLSEAITMKGLEAQSILLDADIGTVLCDLR